MDTAFDFASKHTDRTYRISISLPYAYSKPENWPFGNKPDRWAVIYLLDANFWFGMVTEIVHSMAWCGGTTDAIVVGIGYPEQANPQETWMETMARRNADFTPVRNEERQQSMGEMTKRTVKTGEASRFLQFLGHELIPAVDHDYLTNPSRRILAGHSLGGGFAAFALFEAPDLFDAYVIGSCNPVAQDRYILKCEEAFAQRHRKLASKVYLWAGALEEDTDSTTVSETLRFAELLESRHYEGLTVARHIVADANHCECVAPGFQSGLKFALQA
ncbi:alpha/beta hydrolase [Anaerolineae bacterium CFX9]|nr:alpha/beta hydrolase [Anaerolineae bacterium CFX9]